MKRFICLLCVIVILLCGCNQTNKVEEKAVPTPSETVTKGEFTKKKNGNLVSASGVEYAHLANEGILYYLGDKEFIGAVQGDEEDLFHLGMKFKTGMYAIKDNINDNVLVRIVPNNEWAAIYRKASLPTLDFSVDNCNRLEFVPGDGDVEEDAIHTNCNGGIVDKTEISKFLSDIRAQESPEKAGLYKLVKKANGSFKNCYICGVIYVFFEEEPMLAVQMVITSYDDLAYSVAIGHDEYVLPKKWLDKFEEARCSK